MSLFCAWRYRSRHCLEIRVSNLSFRQPIMLPPGFDNLRIGSDSGDGIDWEQRDIYSMVVAGQPWHARMSEAARPCTSAIFRAR